MKLTGSQREQICDAILAGYDEPNLQRLVEFSLEQRLDQIAGGGNLTDEVAELVRWAERKGYVADLVKAAYERNSKNPALEQLWHDFGEWEQPIAPKSFTGKRSPATQANNGPWRIIALVALLGLLVIGGLWAYNRLNQDGRSITPTLVNRPQEEGPTAVPTQPADPATESTESTAPTVSVTPQPTEAPVTDEPASDESASTAAASGRAADGNKISPGQKVTGELISSETSDWHFDSGPMSIDIILDVGPRGQAAILLYDEGGAEIHYADFQIGPEERLINYEIFDDGVYTIAARNLQNEPTQFTLSVTESAPPQTIGLNETVSGKFYGAEGIGWIFEDGPATISITLDVGPRGEGSISIFDANDLFVTSANGLTGAEERLVNFDIPDSQPYTIIIRNEANGPADYTLTVEGHSN